ncbi:hypothetical protein BDV12DRAFT_191102 [Aspergillus spectabilis]
MPLHPTLSHPPPSRNFKPVIIPQVTKSFDNEIASPFLRAYSPSLQQSQISKTDFLTFLDGLNEAFIANPVLQATSIAGSVIGMIHPVELVGLGIEVASEFGSGATSYFRTRAYLKKVNEEIFIPRGLTAKVVGFDEMCEIVGIAPADLRGWVGRESLAVEDHGIDIGMHERISAAGSTDTGFLEASERHPRFKMLQALEGSVAPLEIKDSPVSPDQQNLLKRWNASFAAREGQMQRENLEKKYRKAKEKRGEKYEEAIQITQKQDKTIAKLEAKMQKLRKTPDKEEKERDKKISRLAGKVAKVHRDQEDEMREAMKRGDKKLQRFQQKQLENTMKIKWLVIYPVNTLI